MVASGGAREPSPEPPASVAGSRASKRSALNFVFVGAGATGVADNMETPRSGPMESVSRQSLGEGYLYHPFGGQVPETLDTDLVAALLEATRSVGRGSFAEAAGKLPVPAAEAARAPAPGRPQAEGLYAPVSPAELVDAAGGGNPWRSGRGADRGDDAKKPPSQAPTMEGVTLSDRFENNTVHSSDMFRGRAFPEPLPLPGTFRHVPAGYRTEVAPPNRRDYPSMPRQQGAPPRRPAESIVTPSARSVASQYGAFDPAAAAILACGPGPLCMLRGNIPDAARKLAGGCLAPAAAPGPSSSRSHSREGGRAHRHAPPPSPSTRSASTERRARPPLPYASLESGANEKMPLSPTA